MKRTLSICMVSFDFFPAQIGGQGIYAYEICRGLASRGHDVHAIVSPTPERLWYYQEHKDFDVRFAGGKTPLLFGTNAYRQFRRHYYEKNFDILHGNEVFTFWFAIRRPKNVDKVIAVCHNSYVERFNACHSIVKKPIYVPYMLMEKIMYSLVDDVIVGSEMEKEAVARYYGVNDSKLHMVYYGTNMEKFALRDEGGNQMIRRNFGIKDDDVIVLFVGRLVERKKPYLVLEAMREIVGRDPRFHCIFVGDGEYKEKLQKSARQYDLVKNVHIVGAVEYDLLPQYYAASDIFVLPSEGEGGVSLVLLEAAASGLPLIVSEDASSHCPILGEGVNGYLVRSSNVSDIRDKILLVAKRAKAMGSESRNIVNRHFTWGKCVEGTLEVYLRP